ncbi:MAG: hypothetical protein AAF998_24040 [Bacteroidota bacterium]
MIFFPQAKLLVLPFLLLSLAGPLQAQPETVPIQKKSTLLIPKLDVFWTAVSIAQSDTFSTFIPVELEINLPSPRISFNITVAPWVSTFSTQTHTTDLVSTLGGLSFRYYFRKRTSLAPSATGFFAEPQLFLYYESKRVQEIGGALTNTSSLETGFFVAGGYQHVFADRIFVQGRLSVGTGAQVAWLRSWRVGEVYLLPWLGVGLRIN